MFFLGAVHMEIVFPLFFRLTGKKILFPCVHIRNISLPGEIYFGELLGGKTLREPITKMGDVNLKNNGSVLLYSKISGLDPQIMFDGSSMSIICSTTT